MLFIIKIKLLSRIRMYEFTKTLLNKIVQSVKKKKKTINSNTNYRKEMKLMPINVHYLL